MSILDQLMTNLDHLVPTKGSLKDQLMTNLDIDKQVQV